MVGSDDLIGRIEGRLMRRPEAGTTLNEMRPDFRPDTPFERPPVPAAVLLPLVRRQTGLSVLYTERSAALRSHSGQIAFPGGKIDPEDRDAADAALREANEEVGLERGAARVLGYMPTYYTGSNYLITPVIALVEPQRPFVPNPDEVNAVFEVPLEWIMDVRNFGTYRLTHRGQQHTTPQLVHGEFVIWGITASLTRQFYDRALAPETGA